MAKFSTWAQTPVDRSSCFREGRWIDMTGKFLGNKAKTGIVNIGFSMQFFQNVLGMTLSEERTEFLRKHLDNCSFELRRGREVFKCQCIKTIERFNEVDNVLCFIFLERK